MSQYSFGKLPPGVLEYLPLRDEAWGLHPGTIVALVYIPVYLGESETERPSTARAMTPTPRPLSVPPLPLDPAQGC